MAYNGKGRPQKPLSERFWAKVSKDTIGTGCWEWTGATNNHGYGSIWEVRDGKGHIAVAHRVSWKLAGRELPGWKNETGLVLDHMCRNPRCVNPDHLRIVTYRDNSRVNSGSPHAINSQMTHCKKCGNAYAGENLAIVRGYDKKKRPIQTRTCLTCYPRAWRNAVIERGPPPGSRPRKHFDWVGPFRTESC